MDELNDRARRLCRFLREFVMVRTRQRRTLESATEVIWLHTVLDLPGCTHHFLIVPDERRRADDWLEVKRLRPTPPPDPPAEIAHLLDRDSLSDPKEERPRVVERFDEDGQKEDEEDPLEALRLEQEIQRYVQEKWIPWRDQERPVRRTLQLYDQLYRIHQRMELEPETYELVLGVGLLQWRSTSGEDIERHLITMRGTISFDAASGKLHVAPAGPDVTPKLEQDMVDEVKRPQPERIREIEGALANLQEFAVDEPELVNQLRSWVHAVHERGAFSAELAPPQGACTDEPLVTLAPAIVLRPRRQQAFEDAFRRIEEAIAEGHFCADRIPPLRAFLNDHDDELGDCGLDPADSLSGLTSDRFLPLPANEEQKRVLEALERSSGVVVQGPPGTGKSHSIVNLLCHLLAMGQRVLITSHRDRALRVLKGLLERHAPQLAPLCVLQYGSERDAVEAMEGSVGAIVSKLNSYRPEDAERRIKDLSKQLEGARQRENELRLKLRQRLEHDSHRHDRLFGDYSGTLAEIVERVHKEAQQYEWFCDDVPEDAEPRITESELLELLDLMRETALNDAVFPSTAPPDLSQIPATIDQAVEDEKRLSGEAESLESAGLPHDALRYIRSPAHQNRDEIRSSLQRMVSAMEAVRARRESWLNEALDDTLEGKAGRWTQLLAESRRLYEEVRSGLTLLEEHSVRLPPDADLAAVRSLCLRLKDYYEQHPGWRWLDWLRSEYRLLSASLGAVSFDGLPLRSADLCARAVNWLDLHMSLERLREYWRRWDAFDGPVGEQLARVSDLMALLQDALAVADRKREVERKLEESDVPSRPAVWSTDELRAWLRAIDFVVLEEQVDRVRRTLLETEEALSPLSRFEALSPHISTMREAVRKRYAGLYDEQYRKLVETIAQWRRHLRRIELMEALRGVAPKLAHALETDPTDAAWAERLRSFRAAWNHRRAQSWARSMVATDEDAQLLRDLETATERVRRTLTELAAERAWYALTMAMTPPKRKQLIAWAQWVRKIGKGKGRRAPEARRNAQAHLDQCRDAIPAWVMPLYRVAETINPLGEPFDVAIIDEASQSDAEAILLAFLARRIVVVGDSKQISPERVGIDTDRVKALQRQYLSDLDHGDAFGVFSFYDLAETLFGGRIRLVEHFRCMPEIIHFCNLHFYDSDPLIPLRQFGSDRLTPVVDHRYVKNGYQQGTDSRAINEPEARAIVEEIQRCFDDPRYKQKTFGVITLLGHAQADLIQSLLVQEIDQRELEKHAVRVGPPSAFQGDERDVIFLSMVSAPNERIGVLSSEDADRRFNVAVSRARDQLVLFHSVTVNDLSASCNRRRLLEYCLNPTVPHLEAPLSPDDLERRARLPGRSPDNVPAPFQSWFEVDVALDLLRKGYSVHPQYPAGSWRIDLVVLGGTTRLAVECDGDHWHGPDRLTEDMERQLFLERLGWRFVRIRESAYRFDRESALRPLWEALEDLHILPRGRSGEEHGAGHEDQPVPGVDTEPPAEEARAPAATRPTPDAEGEPVETIEEPVDRPPADADGAIDVEVVSEDTIPEPFDEPSEAAALKPASGGSESVLPAPRGPERNPDAGGGIVRPGPVRLICDATLIGGGTSVVVAYEDAVGVWDLRTAEWKPLWEPKQVEITAVAVSPDGKYVAVGCAGGALCLWDTARREQVWSMRLHHDDVTGIAFTPDGSRVIAASKDRSVSISMAAQGTLLTRLTGHEDWISALAVSADGRTALTASHDRTLRIWDLAEETCLSAVEWSEDTIAAVALQADGSRAVCGTWNNEVLLWNLHTGDVITRFRGHGSIVCAVSLSPNGHVAVSGSYDRTARVFDLRGRRCMRVLDDHTDWVTAVAQLPDGSSVLTGSAGALRLWDVRTGRILRIYIRPGPSGISRS